MLWECRDSRACESFPLSFNNTLRTNASTLLHIDPSNKDDIVQLWFAIVIIYSDGVLTYSHDKLVAISGLARIFASRAQCGEGYLAGLWRIALEKQLCWLSADRDGCRPSAYRAPSWSVRQSVSCSSTPFTVIFSLIYSIHYYSIVYILRSDHVLFMICYYCEFTDSW